MHVFKMYGGLHKELPYGNSPLSMQTHIPCKVNLSWACHLFESQVQADNAYDPPLLQVLCENKQFVTGGSSRLQN